MSPRVSQTGMEGVNSWLSPTQSIKTSKSISKRETMLSCFQPTHSFLVRWDAQCYDSQQVLETGQVMGLNCVLQSLYFVKQNFLVYCVFNIL